MHSFHSLLEENRERKREGEHGGIEEVEREEEEAERRRRRGERREEDTDLQIITWRRERVIFLSLVKIWETCGESRGVGEREEEEKERSPRQCC